MTSRVGDRVRQVETRPMEECSHCSRYKLREVTVEIFRGSRSGLLGLGWWFTGEWQEETTYTECENCGYRREA